MRFAAKSDWSRKDRGMVLVGEGCQLEPRGQMSRIRPPRGAGVCSLISVSSRRESSNGKHIIQSQRKTTMCLSAFFFFFFPTTNYSWAAFTQTAGIC